MKTRVVPASELSPKDLRAKTYVNKEQEERRALAEKAGREAARTAYFGLKFFEDLMDVISYMAENGTKTEQKVVRNLIYKVMVRQDLRRSHQGLQKIIKGM